MFNIHYLLYNIQIMGIFILSSDNSNISRVIYEHPNCDMMCRELKQGIMIKLLYVNKDTIPMLKCRNPDYLSIVYGYDYKQPYKYDHLIKNKSTTGKIKQSIAEFNAGINMLLTKYNDIQNSDIEVFYSIQVDHGD